MIGPLFTLTPELNPVSFGDINGHQVVLRIPAGCRHSEPNERTSRFPDHQPLESTIVEHAGVVLIRGTAPNTSFDNFLPVPWWRC